jgi:hypothetical protein
VSALEVPAAIAGSVNLVAFSGALAQAGIVGRYDADRGILVIEPVRVRCSPRRSPQPSVRCLECGGTGFDEDAACEFCDGTGRAGGSRD